MEQSVNVRREREDDHAAVFDLQVAAFGERAEAELVDALRSSASPQLSLVAECGDLVAGHVFLSPVTIDGTPPACGCAGLAPIGVLPEFQGRGVGSALMRASLEACEALDWSAVFLLGDPAYYSRFGFALAAPHGYHYESALYDAAFQLIELEPGVLQGSNGFVRYHEAFAGIVAC